MKLDIALFFPGDTAQYQFIAIAGTAMAGVVIIVEILQIISKPGVGWDFGTAYV